MVSTKHNLDVQKPKIGPEPWVPHEQEDGYRPTWQLPMGHWNLQSMVTTTDWWLAVSYNHAPSR